MRFSYVPTTKDRFPSSPRFNPEEITDGLRCLLGDNGLHEARGLVAEAGVSVPNDLCDRRCPPPMCPR
jgi:hypothetical protein